MILIGSRALAIRSPRILRREPVDFDYICTQQELDTWVDGNVPDKVFPTKAYAEGKKWIIESDTNFEFEIIKPGESSEMIYDLVKADKDTLSSPFGLVPSFDMLFTIKTSHRFKKDSPHFWKNLVDWHAMKLIGAKVRPEYEAMLKLREKEAYAAQTHPKLNQSKDAFFSNDGLVYMWDHDTIHQSVAIGEKPAYTYYLKDNEPVQCDKAKFFALPHEVRINGVIEEACVLSIERSLVPHPGVMTPEQAWKFALSKVLSSITSGWFRQFAYENAIEVLQRYPANYWDKFQTDVTTGLVKPFNKGDFS